MNIWTAGIVYMVIYIAENQLFKTQYSAWIWGGLLILFGIYNYWKVGVIQYFILCLVLGTGSWHYEAAEHMNTIFSSLTVYIHLVLFFVVFFTTMPKIIKAFILRYTFVYFCFIPINTSFIIAIAANIDTYLHFSTPLFLKPLLLPL